MRMVFSSRPAFGHVFAIAPLAAAARDAGHEVIFASGDDFLPRLRDWGFETRKVGKAIEWGFQRAAAQFPELLNPENPLFGAKMFVDILGKSSLEDMTVVISEVKPDVVVYEATDVGAGVAAAAADLPVACHSLSLWVDAFLDGIRERTQTLWDASGTDEVVDPTVGHAFIDIWPPSMQSQEAAKRAERHWLLRPLTWGDAGAEVPPWIDHIQGPFVFVSLGTVFWGKELLSKVIEALADVDCDALVLAGVDATPDDFPIKSDRLRIAGFVNQAEVLRRADLVVHHGGAGTMLGTLSQGLPALTLAEGADRPYTADALRRRGASIALDPRAASAADISEAVTTLLNDKGFRETAVAVKEEIEGMPSPAQVVAHLESLVTST
ncbi:MAG: hypothetical protein M3285_03335 [Actinomycetota bacterium]|nr:hypothetical protein [Actinomycetota bacterium]